MRRRRSSSLLGLVVTAVIAVPSAAFVLQRTTSNTPSYKMALTSSSGALSISNSHDGEAILSAAPMLPGSQTTGTVDLVNSGSDSETLTLDAGTPVDEPGPGGGKLSDRLQLRVEDVTTPGAPTTVYDGSLTGLHLADLGTLAKDEQHSYRFVVTFPDGGANGADNAYQGSSASIGFTWTAGAGAPSEPPAGAPYDEQIVADAPVGYWPLDGSTAAMSDALGNHDGQYADSITTADGTAPGGGHAAWFDGTSAYGYVNGLSSPVNGYTLEAWVRPATTDDMVILEQAGAGALAIRSGHFAFRAVDTTLSSADPAIAGQWQQVVATWDLSSGTARLYVDGRLSAESPAPTAPSGSSSTLFLGRGSWATGHTASTSAASPGDESFFHGAMAQVSYYPSALAASRVAAHFDAGKVDATSPTPTTTEPAAPPASGDGGAPPSDAPPAPSDTGAGVGPAPAGPATCPAKVTAQGGKSKKKKATKKPAPKKHLTAKQKARAKALARARAKARAKAKAKAAAKARTCARAGGSSG